MTESGGTAGEGFGQRASLGLRGTPSHPASVGSVAMGDLPEELPADPRAPLLLADGGVVLDRDVRVPVRDGITLSAAVYRPAGPGPHPALLEHLPYRKDDVTAPRDRALLTALALRGFACVRLDVRGTGNSDGIALDEYTEEEQEDGREAVRWIAEQEWCSGAVGAWGNSYGGFAALQLAAKGLPELRAIAAVHASDDRFTDDMHFYGGALCALELAHYPLRMLAMNALPPTVLLDEDGLAAWRMRIESTPPWVLRWLAEQSDGSYWRSGSVRPDYDRIACPVLVVGGWRDGYCNAAVRLARHLRMPCELVVGPWPHVRPHIAPIPPRIDFAGLLADWFGHHLRGDAGERDGRALIFVQGFNSPLERPVRIAGEWRRFEGFPRAEQASTSLALRGDGVLGADPGEPAEVVVEQAPHAGVQTGNWAYPPPPDGLPGDQRLDEIYAALFTTRPLEEELVVLGFPRLRVLVSHPGPTAILSAKLSDVEPTGASQLVTRGVLNLAHRDGHERPRPLEPGRLETVELELNATAWRFAPGHRLRLALAPSDWSTVWPAPTLAPLRLRVGGGAAGLELPLAPPGEPVDLPAERDELPGWGTYARIDPPGWRVVRDGLSCRTGIETRYGREFVVPDLKTSAHETRLSWATVHEADPLTAGVEGVVAFELRRPDVEVRSTARGRYTCADGAFRVELDLEVQLDGESFLRRSWDERIERRLL